MPAQTPTQKAIVGRVMHEFKHGELKAGGGKVRNPRQAIAIGLSEAGASRDQTAPRKRRALDRTRDRDREAGTTRAELYEEARRRGLPVKSSMRKDEIARLVGRPV